MLVVCLVKEHVLAVSLVLGPVLEHAVGRDAVLGAQLLPELESVSVRYPEWSGNVVGDGS